MHGLFQIEKLLKMQPAQLSRQLESDALPVLASAAFMAGGMWWKRKRAQAKVPELVAHKDHLKV